MLVVTASLLALSLLAPQAHHGPGDGGPALEAELAFPLGLALGPGGDLYVSEREGHRVRHVDGKTGIITTVVGTGVAGFSGDGGPAREAQIACPDSIDIDREGNLYIADRCNHRIRRVDAKTGLITTLAGTGVHAVSDDSKPATASALKGPFYVRAGNDGFLYFTDTDSDRIRRIELASGRLETLAGSGTRGFEGDGGSPLEASLYRPHVTLMTSAGDLIIGDSFNQRIRIVEAGSGVIETLAGCGRRGVADEGASMLDAPFGYFGEIHETDAGDLMLTEWSNGRLLKLDMAEGAVRVLAGTTDETAPSADGHAPLETHFGRLADWAFDAEGRVVVVAASQGKVRRIDLEKKEVVTLVGR